MNRKIWVGILMSALLVWWSAKDVQFQDAWQYITEMNTLWLLPFMGLLVAEIFIRALRWQLLLWPVKHCSLKNMCSATLIGMMANNVLPLRAGEFVRAYAGARMEGVPFSTSLATAVIDRVLDGLTISAVFLLCLLLRPLPEDLPGQLISVGGVKIGGYITGAIYVFALAVLVSLIVKEAATIRLLSTMARVLPTRLREFAIHFLTTFVSGLGVFRSGGLTLAAVAISVVVWLGWALSIYFVAAAFGLSLTIVDSFIVLAILTIAIALPSTPGFVGTMDGAIILGLMLFGVDKEHALAVAVVYHVAQWVPITLGGFIALWLERLSLGELAAASTRAAQT